MNKSEASSAPTAISSPVEKRSLLKWVPVILPLGYLWFHLIDNLRLEWSSNPQYSYGLVVPLLVVGLLLRRWIGISKSSNQNSDGGNQFQLSVFGISAFLLAFLYLPTRLVEAATPEWRPLQWSLGIQTVGLTLYAFYLAGGKGWLRQAAFPVAFFLVAIPWPTLVEAPVIQGLSRLNAALVVDVMGFLDVPAMQHGNVIEVGTGMVGINDACSGIRSLQTSLMISLFLGEFYRLNWQRRFLLVPFSFVLAMLLNLSRASLLTWIAAKKGVAAIAEYHDEAGLTISLVCTALLWGTAWLLHLRSASIPAGRAPAANQVKPDAAIDGDTMGRRLKRFGLMLLVWLAMVEGGVGLWYHLLESNRKLGPDWTVNFPVDNPTFKELPLTTEARALLQFDQGKNGKWQEADGTVWQAFYFNWQPGRVAGYLAKRHTPEICLTASGLKMTAGPRLEIMNVKGVELPMRCYTFDSSGGPLQVFQCRWEAGAGKESFTAQDLTRFNLIRAVWAGRGNQGQKVLEIIISGCDDPELAKQALVRQLDKLIKVEN